MNIFDPALHRRNRMLSALAAEDFAHLAPHLKEVALVARAVLHETEDEIEHVLFPHSGMVSLFAVTDDGEAIETAAVGPEGAVGAGAALGMRHAFGRALVQVPGTGLRIASAQMQRLACENARIRDMAVRANEAALVQAQQAALCGTLHGVEQRLARWLLQAQDRTGGDAIPLIQEQLAQVLGARRTTVNLTIRKLVEGGRIRYRRGLVEVVDRAGLKSEACACYGIVRRQLERLQPAANGANKI